MAKAIKIFEPVTEAQIKKIHSIARKKSIDTAVMYQAVADLIGLASLTALSKQEAIFLIEKLQGQNRRRYPSMPSFSDAIDGDTSKLPSFYHIRDIRLFVQKIGWDKQQLKNWLVRYRKVKDLRSMDREQAKTTYFVLKGMAAKVDRQCVDKQANQ